MYVSYGLWKWIHSKTFAITYAIIRIQWMCKCFGAFLQILFIIVVFTERVMYKPIPVPVPVPIFCYYYLPFFLFPEFKMLSFRCVAKASCLRFHLIWINMREYLWMESMKPKWTYYSYLDMYREPIYRLNCNFPSFYNFWTLNIWHTYTVYRIKAY